MKIRPVAAELFHADRQSDGRTDMTKLIVAVRNFANAARKRNEFNYMSNNKRTWAPCVPFMNLQNDILNLNSINFAFRTT